MPKLSMTDNPITHAKQRYWLLEKRKRRLSGYRRTIIQYSENGVASSMVINTDPRVSRASRLRGEIRNEQHKIQKFIHQNGYTLA